MNENEKERKKERKKERIKFIHSYIFSLVIFSQRKFYQSLTTFTFEWKSVGFAPLVKLKKGDR